MQGGVAVLIMYAMGWEHLLGMQEGREHSLCMKEEVRAHDIIIYDHE